MKKPKTTPLQPVLKKKPKVKLPKKSITKKKGTIAPGL
jgi:hypothetical protein